MKNNSIILCGIVRDAAKGLKKNIPIIDLFLNNFKNFQIIIFENDSQDDTKLILEQWADRIGKDNFHLISEFRGVKKTIPKKIKNKNINPFYSFERINRMVELRNQYLDYIQNNNITSEVIMIADLDVAQLNLKGLLSIFNINFEWDAICANGVSTSPQLKNRYHDAYALVELGDDKNPQTEEKIKYISKKFGKIKKNDNPIQIFSGFGGVTFYKFKHINSLRYQVIKNNDPRVEVRCEHFSIYKQMIELGNDKIFLLPSLILKYQSITIKLLITSFLRYFRSFIKKISLKFF